MSVSLPVRAKIRRRRRVLSVTQWRPLASGVDPLALGAMAGVLLPEVPPLEAEVGAEAGGGVEAEAEAGDGAVLTRSLRAAQSLIQKLRLKLKLKFNLQSPQMLPAAAGWWNLRMKMNPRLLQIPLLQDTVQAGGGGGEEAGVGAVEGAAGAEAGAEAGAGVEAGVGQTLALALLPEL